MYVTKKRERRERKSEKEGRIVSREGWESGRNVKVFRGKCVKRGRVSGIEEKEQERRMRGNCVRKCEYETYV